MPATFVGVWEDSFTEARVEPFPNWSAVRVHDTRQDSIEIKGGMLHLALDTRGTKDQTVKLRGVRSRRLFLVPPRGKPLRLTIAFDWNQQFNGSYLSMGFALVPSGAPAGTAPHRLPGTLAFEWIGVPPGKRARPFLWARRVGGLRPLYTEGWPQARREDRKGRLRGKTQITLEATAKRIRLLEGERELHAGPGSLKGPCHLLLFVTGHSNYPERSVTFQSVRVEAPAPSPTDGTEGDR